MKHMMPAVPRVSVVIPTMNRREKLARLIASVQAAEPAGGMEIIVVDNGSTDGTPTMIRESFPEIALVTYADNRYSAAARNAGADVARGAHVFFVDDDNVLETGCIGSLADALDRHPDMGIVAPLMLRHDVSDEIWCAGGTLSATGMPRHRLGGTSYAVSRLPEFLDAEYFPNAYMIRGSLARGGFRHDAADFPHNWAEQDFCARVREAGYRVTMVSAAVTRHDVGYRGSITRVSADRALDQARARILYRRKYFGSSGNWLWFLFVILPFSTAYYMVKFAQSPDPFLLLAAAYARGTYEGFTKRL